MRKKLADIITKIWGVATFILLFLGALSSLGYLLALILGGEAGALISVFIYKKIFPVIIFSTTCLIVLGWIKMELSSEKALTGDFSKK